MNSADALKQSCEHFFCEHRSFVDDNSAIAAFRIDFGTEQIPPSPSIVTFGFKKELRQSGCAKILCPRCSSDRLHTYARFAGRCEKKNISFGNLRVPAKDRQQSRLARASRTDKHTEARLGQLLQRSSFLFTCLLLRFAI